MSFSVPPTNSSSVISVLRSLGISNTDTIPIPIPNTEIIVPLDAVVDSGNGLKTVFQNNYFLAHAIDINLFQIINSRSYSSVLTPIVKINYLENNDFFWILNVPIYNQNVLSGKVYFQWKDYSSIINRTIGSLSSFPFYKDLVSNLQTLQPIITNLIKTPTLNGFYQYGNIAPWLNTLKLFIYTIIPDLLDNTRYIMVMSGLDLKQYFPTIKNSLSSLSTDYINLTQNLIEKIVASQFSDWTNNSTYDNQWSFATISNYSSIKCIQSNLYPKWNGQPISECYIPNSDFDNPKRVLEIIKDLNSKYSTLTSGQLVISTYTMKRLSDTNKESMKTSYYISLVKLVGAPLQLPTSFKEKIIEINPFFEKPEIVIQNNLSVQTYDGTPVIQTENVSKIVTITKLGINQPSYDVNGLLDIKNISVSSMIDILDKFDKNQLSSYDMATFFNTIIILPGISPENILTNPLLLSLVQSYFGFSVEVITQLITSSINGSVPLYILEKLTIPEQFKSISYFNVAIGNQGPNGPTFFSIKPSDINYILSASSFLSGPNPSLDAKSFIKINTIINEFYKMKSEFINYITITGNTPIFSFVEILNDGVYNYLCSIRMCFYNDPFNNNNPTLLFIISSLNVQNIMIHPSYSQTFVNMVEQMSSANRLVNYSSLVIYEPSVGIYNNNTLTGSSSNCIAFTEYINQHFSERFGGNNIYTFCNKVSQSITESVLQPYSNTTSYDQILFNELHPEWSNIETKNLFAEDSDLYQSKASFNIYNSLMTNFEFRENFQFAVHYKLDFGQNYVSCLTFTIGTQKYMLGCSVNLQTIIGNAIVSTGDITSAGDITVSDSKNNTIFQISNIEKKVTSAYNVGIGKDQPQTTLDVNDSSMSSILSVIDKITTIYEIFNNNIDKIINYNPTNDPTFSNVFSEFIDPLTGVPIIYNPFHYFSMYQLNSDSIINDQKVIYHWLFSENDSPLKVFNNILPTTIGSLPSCNQTNFILNFVPILLNQTINIHGEHTCVTYNWVYGKKHGINRNFTNIKDKNTYLLNMGVDLQQYNLRYNTNSNIDKLFSCINTYQSLIDRIIDSTINNNPIELIDGFPLGNYIKPLEFLKNSITSIGNPQSITEYKMYTTLANITESIVYPQINQIDYTQITNTIADLVELFNKPLEFSTDNTNIIYSQTDNNLLIMYQSLAQQVITKYPILTTGQNGIVWFEDSRQYYVSIFYCTGIGNDENLGPYVNIISIELSLDKFIIPTVYVNGDTCIHGEISARILNTNVNFATIDPDRNFIGFNTDERDIYYTYLNNQLAHPLVYALNKNYPSAVFDSLLTYDATNPYQSLYQSTSITTKRRNNDSLFHDLAPTGPVGSSINTLTYTPIIGSTGLSGPTSFYGVNMGFELTNKYYESQQLGAVGMVIESVEDDEDTQVYTVDGYIKAGFLITATDIDATQNPPNNPNIPLVTTKQLMYVSNDGVMDINGINVNAITVNKGPSITGLSTPPQISNGTSSSGNYVTNNLYVATDGNLYYCLTANGENATWSVIEGNKNFTTKL